MEDSARREIQQDTSCEIDFFSQLALGFLVQNSSLAWFFFFFTNPLNSLAIGERTVGDHVPNEIVLRGCEIRHCLSLKTISC